MKVTKHFVAVATFLVAVAQMASADSAKHLSQSESIAAAVTKPQPEYSAIAKQLKLEGTVSLNAFVTEDGTVDHVETVSGNHILLRSAGGRSGSAGNSISRPKTASRLSLSPP